MKPSLCLVCFERRDCAVEPSQDESPYGGSLITICATCRSVEHLEHEAGAIDVVTGLLV